MSLQTTFKNHKELARYANKIGWVSQLGRLIEPAIKAENLNKIPFVNIPQAKSEIDLELSEANALKFLEWVSQIEVDNELLFPNLSYSKNLK